MEIKEKKVQVSIFEVDGISFNSMEEAESYIQELNKKHTWNYFYVYCHPNLVDGGYYAKRRYCVELEDSQMARNLLIQRLLSEFGSAIDYIGHSYQTPILNFVIDEIPKNEKDWLMKFESNYNKELEKDNEIIKLSLNKPMTQLETEYEKNKKGEGDLTWH